MSKKQELIRELTETVNSLEMTVEYDKGTWAEYEKSLVDGDFDGAGNWFGHADDCFEAGERYATYYNKMSALEAYRNILKKLEDL